VPAIKLLEKGSISDYPIIIVKVLKSLYEYLEINLKLEVSDNRKSWYIIVLLISSNVKDDIMFIVVRELA